MVWFSFGSVLVQFVSYCNDDDCYYYYYYYYYLHQDYSYYYYYCYYYARMRRVSDACYSFSYGA